MGQCCNRIRANTEEPAKYQKIREAIESESRIKIILYLVPTDELFSSLMHEFWRTKKCVLLGMVNYFKRERLKETLNQSALDFRG